MLRVLWWLSGSLDLSRPLGDVVRCHEAIQTALRDMNDPTWSRVWLAGFVAMAVALHIQPTLSVGAGEVRFSLFDVLGFLAAPVVLWLAWVNRRKWNRRETWIAVSLAAAGSAVMTIGLVRAGASPQGISNWAIVKYAGWYVLVYYGILGVLAAHFAPEKAIEWFIGAFVLLHAILVVAFIVLSWMGIDWPGPETPRMTGMYGNANAYALSLLCALAVLIGTRQEFFANLPGYAFEFLSALICAGVLFTRSLGALAGLVVLVAIALALRRDFVRMVRVTCAALALYALPWAGNAMVRAAGLPVAEIRAGIGEKLSDPDKYAFSLTVRVESNLRAIALWRSAPVLGAGLGFFYEKEKASARTEQSALQVHNTLLWMLAEFGLIGAFAFGAMVLAALSRLYRAWRSGQSGTPVAGLVPAGIMIMGAWITMSMAHELMYQRVGWFFVAISVGAAGLSDDAISVEPLEPGPRV